jgi:hypothetical protein
VDVGSLSLGLLLQLGVVLDAADELLSRAGKGDVLDAEVDTLLDVAVLDLLVDDDTDSALGDVVNNSGLSVVNLMWHTRMKSAFILCHFDIRQVSIRRWNSGRRRRLSALPNATHPFWTAPFALISTISPTLYCLK